MDMRVFQAERVKLVNWLVLMVSKVTLENDFNFQSLSFGLKLGRRGMPGESGVKGYRGDVGEPGINGRDG